MNRSSSAPVVADVAVVGAGPAGIAAAVAADRHGASVVLVDEAQAPGGQIWRRHRSELTVDAPARVPREAQALLRELANGDVRVLSGTTVWAVAHGRTLLTHDSAGTAGSLHAERYVLASGAYDRPVAFPGWTTPGVLTAGAAQTLAKTQDVVPGRRILLAGAGPFLLPVAAQLLAGGAEVVAIAEATGRRDWLARGARMLPYPRRLAEYGRYRARLRRVPMLWRHVIRRVEGEARVERATLTAVDSQWHPRSGTDREYRVDAVCTAYGFVPRSGLAAELGCQIRDGAVEVDDDLRTSVPDVFAAGEVTGIGGADLARVEGTIAGLGAAGARPPAPLLRRRRHLLRFAAVMDELFAPRAGLWELPDAGTPLCRCEDVTAGEVDAAVAAGADGMRALKIVLRCGQGPCQGAICGPVIGARIGDTPGAEPPSQRPPLRPVPLGILASVDERPLTEDRS